MPGTGHIAPIRAVWELAQPWYGDRLDADFTPHTREHNQLLLENCGFTGEFWRLP
ncbi:hypothetical protein [Brachybacterium aquaticum]|uniref:Uncharacterized protein n=1 Tax=Brachybacterium aquaticum TaxID=1432564 RepID=A0A841AGJ5_9MICO|nr:hypothetical protein [Brachybacterium aquaticum]MBB5833047.1 hypothetical protein [Brachybacterium aquaticum]